MDDELKRAALKRAVGYTAEETVEEYGVQDGELVLVKRRVTMKDVPPDISAVKMMIEADDTPELTDEELEREKRRLIEELLRLQGESEKSRGNVNE